VSLRTAFLASKYAVRAMIDQGTGGAIVNVSSIVAFRGTGHLAYSAAKGGMQAMTVDMAYSHGRQGIRVNAVAPGHIVTPLLYSVVGQGPETDFADSLRAESCLLGTHGTGWDVAWAVTFLASDEARWITGATLPVDGGVMSVTPLMMAERLRAVVPPPVG
jgi:NAD(P)-dependent dehydrogenase (short-subunit alcohol dehydrogenase family)